MRIEDFKLFLMVDDSDDELFLTKAIFQHSYPGIQFRCEKDPAQVIGQLGRASATGMNPAQMCVLLDIRMPRTNGFELIYKLRNDIDVYACCILMLSASRGHDDRDNAEALGADGYVSKPFTVAKLQDALAPHRGAMEAA
jgi:CheY-like chemotaxis protein